MIKPGAVARFILGMALGLMLLALVAFNGMLIWVATGPRSLAQFTPYIEQALSGESDAHVKINETWLLWDGWRRPVDLRLKGVSLIDRDGQVFSSFPEISVGLDVLSLPLGRILPTSLSVSKPVVALRQNEDRTLAIGSGDGKVDSNNDALAALIESLINPHSKSSLRKLRSIELLDADMRIDNVAGETVLSAPDTTLVIRKESASQLNAVVNTVLYYADSESPVKGVFAYNKEKRRLEGVMETSRLRIATLSKLLYQDPVLAGLQFPVSGKVGFGFARNGELETLEFDVTGGHGQLVHEAIDGPLPVSKLRLVGKATNGLRNLRIDQANINFGGSVLSANGNVVQTDAGMAIQGRGEITDVPADSVRKFWPLAASPMSREWVVNNIRDGGVTKASVVVNIQPGDLQKHGLPKEAIDATIEVKDAKIKYLEGHPELRGVNAVIRVDGQALDASVSQAQAFSDTRLSNGRVLIADLAVDNPLLEIDLNADAAARDIVTLLGLPMLEHAKNLNLAADKTTGRASGEAKIGFHFFAHDEQGRELPITYHVRSQLHDVGTPAFLERFDIAGANGELMVDEEAAHFTGSANVNGSDITSGDVRYAFRPEQGIDTVVKATGTVNDAVLAKFGVDLPVAIKEKRVVSFEARMATAGKITSIESFSVKGEGVDVQGSAQLTPGGADLGTLRLSKLVYDRTQLSSLDYVLFDRGFKLSAKGQAFDANPLMDKGGEGFSFENFPAMELNFQVGTLYAANNEELQDVRASLACDKVRCASADITAQAGGKPMRFGIRSQGKTRRLSMNAGNAGAVLSALDVIDSMEEGEMAIVGQYAPGGMLEGKLSINDYTLKNAPTLAKMLSLASLTGFFDTLSGKGITFKKLNAPFTLDNDVITLKEAKTYGPAIGLTADGTITLPKSILNLEGTIIPSYTLNNVLGNVPILGNILTGGEGGGVFAARYTMKGDSDNPDVMVNPLSILTPGFLRNVFDIF